MRKRGLFYYKKVKKSTPNVTSPQVHGLFTIALIKTFFEKNQSSRAVSGNRTQFKPEVTPEISLFFKKLKLIILKFTYLHFLMIFFRT